MKAGTFGEPRRMAPEEPPADGEGDPLAVIVLRASEGDEAARREVFRCIARPVLSVIRVLLGPGHPELEDVAQESLLAIHDALPRFRGDSSFLHYARRIAVRTALHARRRAPTALAVDVADMGDLTSPQTSEALGRERRLAAFRSLVDELPEGQAESLALRVALGHSLGQVAEATGVPVNTVRSRIRLAKERLKERILSDPQLSELFEVES